MGRDGRPTTARRSVWLPRRCDARRQRIHNADEELPQHTPNIMLLTQMVILLLWQEIFFIPLGGMAGPTKNNLHELRVDDIDLSMQKTSWHPRSTLLKMHPLFKKEGKKHVTQTPKYFLPNYNAAALDRKQDAEYRIFFNSLGDFIESTSFFPFEINIPDLISAMWSYMTSFFVNREEEQQGTQSQQQQQQVQQEHQS